MLPLARNLRAARPSCAGHIRDEKGFGNDQMVGNVQDLGEVLPPFEIVGQHRVNALK